MNAEPPCSEDFLEGEGYKYLRLVSAHATRLRPHSDSLVPGREQEAGSAAKGDGPFQC